MLGDTPEQPDAPEGGGPVHYQVSITGRQAAAFFLMLLVALGLAFFFGMKTGAAARKGGDAVAQIAGASDIPVPTIPPEERSAASATPTPEPAEKKLGFEDAGPASTAPAAAASTSVPAPTPTHAAAAPKPAETGAEKPEKAEKAEKAAPARWHVQVFATKDGRKADEWVKKLKKEGFKADVVPSPRNDELFLVRVGPYGDKAKAEAQRKRILKSNPGLKGLMVVPS